MPDLFEQGLGLFAPANDLPNLCYHCQGMFEGLNIAGPYRKFDGKLFHLFFSVFFFVGDDEIGLE